jgi:hypothetical protein
MHVLRTLAAIGCAVLIAGCATGYGCLAGGGAGTVLGVVAATSASRDYNASFDASIVASGFVLGGMFGCIGGAVSAAVAREQERRKIERERRDDNASRRQQLLEAKIVRLEAQLHERATSRELNEPSRVDVGGTAPPQAPEPPPVLQ